MLQEQVSVPPRYTVGASLERIDALPKVTGRAIYTRDMLTQRMLWGKIKRCPYPHAKILKIDVSHAVEMPGVKAVIVGKDFPELPWGVTPPLAYDEVRYANQAVVAVAAESKIIAEDAVESIEVEYEELPAILDPRMPFSKSFVPNRSETAPEPEGISKHVWLVHGDVDSAFQKTSRIFENVYKTPSESHFQLEPLSFLARSDIDGGVTIWATGQPNKTRYELAQYLGIDPCLVRVKVPFLGGWFGGKEEGQAAAICAMLALKAKRPVKLDFSREETITATGVRHPAEIRIKDGVTEEGRIVSRKIEGIYDGGAFGLAGGDVMYNALFIATLYNIPNFQMDAYRVVTNRVPGTPKRGPIIGQMTWAVECQMDYVANALKIDPLTIRRKNILHEGEKNPLGEKLSSISHDRCLNEVTKAIQWGTKRQSDGPWRWGKGVSLSVKGGVAGNPHQVKVIVKDSGKVEVHADLVEQGCGILTTIQQIVAAEFSIGPEDVVMLPAIEGTSTSFGLSSGATGSRQLVNMGNAAVLACQDAKSRITELAAKKLGTDANLLEVRDRSVYVKSDPSKYCKISELFNYASISGSKRLAGFIPGANVVDLAGYGTVFLSRGQRDPQTGEYISGRHSYYYVNAANAVELCVNTETGIIRVNHIAAAQDVGRAINPTIVRGQIVGQVYMSLSEALGEELDFSAGRVTNPNLADYKILTSNEMPVVTPIIVETPYEGGPYGAKGAAEACMLSTPPAVRNALHDAIGVWINDLPMTPERVLDALDGGNGRDA